MKEPDFTILGCDGVIGAALTAALRIEGRLVRAVNRATLPDLLTSTGRSGHVISCIGLTGDYRSRPFDAAEAHVGVTARCLEALRCQSFLWLSSTRVYARASAAHEDAILPCAPADPSDIYNLTKLTGEALCLADPRAEVRVVRLSNVYSSMPGAGTFLGQVIAAGRATGRVLFRQGPDSEKDYISLADVARLLPVIATHGHSRLYNVASGRNTRHREIAATLSAAIGWHTEFAKNAPTVRYPPIATARLCEEFQPSFRDLVSDLATLARTSKAPSTN